MDDINRPSPAPASDYPGATPPAPAPQVYQPAEPTTPLPATPPPQPPSQPAYVGSGQYDKPRRFKGLLSVVELVGAALLLAVFINHFVFQSYQVFGESMTPTLGEGDRLIISKVNRSWAKVRGGDYVPARGDIIVFTSPMRSEVQLIKRVIGLPGERVVVKEGKITVYNQERAQGFDPDEPYKSLLPEYTTGNVDLTVGDHQLFVSGDNRLPGGSLDSRNDLGLVPIDSVVGKLVFRLLPVDEIKTF